MHSMTIKIFYAAVSNEDCSFIPLFRTPTKINLEKFKINRIQARDIWLFSRLGNNIIISKEILLFRVNQKKTWKTEIKCFLEQTAVRMSNLFMNKCYIVSSL